MKKFFIFLNEVLWLISGVGFQRKKEREESEHFIICFVCKKIFHFMFISLFLISNKNSEMLTFRRGHVVVGLLFVY